MRKVLGIAGLTLGVVVLAGPASATPVSFPGGSFDVTYSDLGSGVYRFVSPADFTGGDDTTSITALDFGFAGWHDVDSVTSVSGTAPGSWVVAQGNASANKCNESSHQFKTCAQEDPLLLSASTDNDQIHTWTIDVADDSLGDLGALTSDENPIEAVFYTLDCKTKRAEVTCKPQQADNMSLTTDYGTTTSTTDTTDTPSGVAPEPTIMTLLGAGLMLAGRRLRRRSS